MSAAQLVAENVFHCCEVEPLLTSGWLVVLVGLVGWPACYRPPMALACVKVESTAKRGLVGMPGQDLASTRRPHHDAS